MSLKTIFFDGRICRSEPDGLDEIADALRKQARALHDIEVDELVEFFDAVGRHWLRSPGIKKRFGPTLKFLAKFMDKGNLTTLLDTALRDRHALDGFVKLNKTKMLFHAQPRGLTVHWIAGNVPVLGIFSVLQALLTKNACLVKASSRSYEDMTALLQSFSEVSTKNLKGNRIAKAVAVVLVEREDKESQRKLSMSADVRIAWGGREAVDAITRLERRAETEDIIYGPKYSYAVIGREKLRGDVRPLAYKLAIDASAFDQYACSSPHTVFVERGGKASPLDFAEELAKQMDFVSKKVIQPGKPDPGRSLDILKARNEYEFRGQVFSSKNTDWTVIYSDEQGLAQACFSRVVFVRPVDDISDVCAFSGRGMQTMGVAVSDERRRTFADSATVRGIDRCPPIGEMSFFQSPWDGMFAFDRLVRWVTTYE
ncbi:MAG: hypothetical protein JXC85_05510 [Candidatus Aenigmarchaeota archaeon]|nr:hypothetical protein [Candidatus Aenigmarchaeota archaeon]